MQLFSDHRLYLIIRKNKKKQIVYFTIGEYQRDVIRLEFP
jgi:PHD/YefM family antitoxin component YafN of YafNO toxin-antitoxin module